MNVLVGLRLLGAELTPDMNRTKRYGKLALPMPSHPLSSIVRGLIEKTGYKKILAANAMLMGIAFNAATLPSHAFNYTAVDRLELDGSSVEITTEKAFENPIVTPTGVSQGYGAFHPGVDIRAPKGSSIVSLADGIVVEVKHGFVGYGNYVRVAHAGTVSTLYAHMEEVEVEVGEKVHKGQELGTVGTTGWSTGPHLHLEIYEGNRAVNPKNMIAI